MTNLQTDFSIHARDAVDRAMHLRKEHRFDESVAVVAELAEQPVEAADRPAKVDVLFSLARSFHALQRIDDELAVYDRALTLSPHHVKTLTAKGNVCASIGRLAEAESCLKLAERLATKNIIVQNSIANLKARQGDEGGALAAFDRAIALDTSNDVSHGAKASYLFKNGHTLQALLCVENGLGHVPESVQLLATRHKMRTWLQREAVNDNLFEKTLNQFPDNISALAGKAILAATTSRNGEALALFGKAITLAEKNALTASPLRRLPGQFCYHHRRDKEAVNWLAPLLQNSDEQAALYILAATNGAHPLRNQLSASLPNDLFDDLNRKADKIIPNLRSFREVAMEDLNDLIIDLHLQLQQPAGRKTSGYHRAPA